MKTSILTYLFLAVFFLSCGDNDDCPNNEKCLQDCPTNLACTEQFVTIGLNITLNGEPIRLEDYKSIINETQEEFTWEDDFLGFEGYHVILTDAQMDKVSKDGTDISIQGTITSNDTTYAVDELFVIGHDCCHIVKLQGPETLELNP